MRSLIIGVTLAAALTTSTATAETVRAVSFVVYQGYTDEVIGTCSGKRCWRAIVKATPGKNERVVKYRTKRNGEVRAVQVREPREVRRRGARRQG